MRPVLLLALLVCVSSACVSSEKAEDRAWEKTPKTADGYQSFLAKYPTGRHAARARSNLAALRIANARRIDTIPAYEEFLAQHPDSSYAAEISGRIAEERRALDAALNSRDAAPLEAFITRYPKNPRTRDVRALLRRMQQAPGFGEVVAVDVVINESYGDADRVKLGFDDLTGAWLAAAGLDRAATAAGPRATLTVNVKGQARGLPYQRFGGKDSGALVMHLSGADAKGTVMLRSRSGQITEAFDSKIGPFRLFGVQDLITNPNSAPFKDLLPLPEGPAHKIALVMVRAFGTGVALHAASADQPVLVRVGAIRTLADTGGRTDMLIALLSAREPAIARVAAESLGRVRATTAIDPLITALQSSDQALRKAALDSLKVVTRQDFGPDAAKWKQWRHSPANGR